MSQLADRPLGLRERKKIKLRQAVQREALSSSRLWPPWKPTGRRT
jgi:hypothetical protein